MLMKQVIKQDDGQCMVSWIDAEHAVKGRRVDLKLGDGDRSPVMTVAEVWGVERDLEDLRDQKLNRKGLDAIMTR
jgi:hypothetical protein